MRSVGTLQTGCAPDLSNESPGGITVKRCKLQGLLILGYGRLEGRPAPRLDPLRRSLVRLVAG